MKTASRMAPFEIRASPVHGLGAFALRRIRRGTRIAEYTGERLTEAEVDARYNGAAVNQPHTFLFLVRDDVYVDASRNGNDARFINHSCAPNCGVDIVRGRIVIKALKTIEPGTELTYDYALEVEDDPSPARQRLFACRCGAARCRGTMLDIDARDRKRRQRAS